jgi:hypothetical protein
MAIDSTLPVRRAILTCTKNTAAITELLPATQQHTSTPPRDPVWPFSRYENYGPSTPVTATCLDGQELNVRFHVFAKPRLVAGIVLARISDTLDRRRFPIDRGHMQVSWRGSYVMQDGDEADAYHGFVSLRIRAMTV